MHKPTKFVVICYSSNDKKSPQTNGNRPESPRVGPRVTGASACSFWKPCRLVPLNAAFMPRPVPASRTPSRDAVTPSRTVTPLSSSESRPVTGAVNPFALSPQIPPRTGWTQASGRATLGFKRPLSKTPFHYPSFRPVGRQAFLLHHQ